MKQIKRIYSKIAIGAYQIGFVINDMQSVIFRKNKYRDVQWINTNKFTGSWFADPFILDYDDEWIEVLAEEYQYNTSLGRISLLKIGRGNLILEEVKPLLDLDTHLSFPYIIRRGGDIYVMPENNQSGSLFIYEYDKYNKVLINKTMLINEPLVDSQYVELDGKHYIWGLPYSCDNFENTKIVSIYKAENFFGPYSKIQSICSDYKDKRGAGSFLFIDNNIIRPTQCCEGGYGKEVVFWKVLKDENNIFSEVNVGTMTPHIFSKYPLQLHTYNEYKGMQIIDGYAYTKPFFRHILNIRNVIMQTMQTFYVWQK